MQQDAIEDKIKAFFTKSVPDLWQQCSRDNLLLWILKVSQKTVSLNKKRLLSAADQKFWLMLADKLSAKIPEEFQHLVSDHNDNPINLLQNMIDNMNQEDIEEAVGLMKNNMVSKMKEGIWGVAAYAKEMIYIEEMKRHKDLESWINLHIDLDDKSTSNQYQRNELKSQKHNQHT